MSSYMLSFWDLFLNLGGLGSGRANPVELRYPVTLTPAAEGGFVMVRHLRPKAIAESDDVAEALANAATILAVVMEFYIDAARICRCLVNLPGVSTQCA